MPHRPRDTGALMNSFFTQTEKLSPLLSIRDASWVNMYVVISMVSRRVKKIRSTGNWEYLMCQMNIGGCVLLEVGHYSYFLIKYVGIRSNSIPPVFVNL